jgi:hypothetical protein
VGRFVNGSRLHTKCLAQCLPEQVVGPPRRFIRRVTREGDDAPLAVEHDDLVADARNQLERTDSESAKRSNQFFLLIDASRHIKAGIDDWMSPPSHSIVCTRRHAFSRSRQRLG